MIYRGDCFDVLKTLEANSIHSLITDPPAGIGFMGKDWDSGNNFIPAMTIIFQECLRVMKPGAHGLVWALPRTSHWTATALENAGFEIRDVITHLFGSGFPKSHDISKGIDKSLGTEGPITGKNPAYRERQLEHDAQWETAMRPEFKHGPGSDEAKQWQGWGTALKPASEHWILIRKPCSEKTVAANVLKHGTGGINIDACRIEGKPRTTHSDGNFQSKTKNTEVFGNFGLGFQCPEPQGRFPANLVLDEVAAEMLDEQSGFLHKAGNKRDKLKPSPGGYRSTITGEKNPNYHNDEGGGASRFFYCAKASKKDRGEDNKHPTVKSTKLMEYLITLVTPPGGKVLDPFMGSGSTGVAAKRLGFEFIGIEKNEEYFEIAEKRIGA